MDRTNMSADRNVALRLAKRLAVLGCLVALLALTIARPAEASGGCGAVYQQCDDACYTGVFLDCIGQGGTNEVCLSLSNQCRAECQAIFYDCVGSGGCYYVLSGCYVYYAITSCVYQGLVAC